MQRMVDEPMEIIDIFGALKEYNVLYKGPCACSVHGSVFYT